MMWKPLVNVMKIYGNQFAAPETLKRIQEKRIRVLVHFAYNNSPLYHRKFRDAGITPEDIVGLEDMYKIPLITKEEIRTVFPQGIVAPGFSRENCTVKTTSGTSGSVFTMLYDREAEAYFSAISYRDHLAQGLRPWHKFFVLQHDPAQLNRPSRTILQRVKGVSGILPEEELVKEARAFQPDFMGGHPSAYVAMATVVKNNEIKDLNPQAVLLGGEVAYPSYRKYIEKIFECRTSNKYGSYETHSIAWECQHLGMHINADSVLVEFLKRGEPVAPGERGEVVVTNLWNRAMPLIRYRMGDIGIPSEESCSCGRSLPLMKDLEGRADDFIVLPSGRAVPPTRLIPPFFLTPHVGQFKMIQETKSWIRIQIVPRETLPEEEENALLQQIRNVFQEPVDIEVERVEKIQQEGRGKFKAVISKVGMSLA
ncbi:MAG: phenylacetate--CoA ligase family protein [Theionarchaea archaeon]|nr:phenylacetate--CoA ligase family protein [Theionarchaea archaeon]